MHDHLADSTLANLDLPAVRERAAKPFAIATDKSLFYIDKEAQTVDAVEKSQADVTPLLDALDSLVEDRAKILKGARCPQCSATEWNGASIERNKNAAMVEALSAHMDAEHHVEYETSADEAHGNNARCSCGRVSYPCDGRIALEAIIAANAKG